MLLLVFGLKVRNVIISDQAPILRATWHQIFFFRVIFCASLLLPHSIDKPPPSWYICPILAQEEPIATWERTIPGQRVWGCSSKVALAVSPAPVTALARTRRAGSFADGIMASMSVDEIRVKVGQNLRFGAEC